MIKKITLSLIATTLLVSASGHDKTKIYAPVLVDNIAIMVPVKNETLPTKTKAYFGDKLNNLIDIVDVDNMSLIAQVPTGHEITYAAESIELNGVVSKFYIDNRGSNVIDVLDAKTNTITKSINLPFYPRSLEHNKNTDLVVVSGKNKTMGAVIDARTDRLLLSVGDTADTTSTGHPQWLDDTHFVIPDREHNRLLSYAMKKRNGQWSATLLNALSTPSSVHTIIPPSVHGQHGKQHGNEKSIIFYATAEGSATVNGALLKLEFLPSTGLSIVDSISMPDSRNTGTHHHNFLADKHTVYVGTKGGDVCVIDYRKDLKIIKTFKAGIGAGHTAEFKKNNIAVVINHNDTFITLVDTRTHTNIGDIKVSNISEDEVGVVQTQSHPAYHFSADGRYFYLFLTEEGAIVKVDLVEKKLVERLDLDGHLSMGAFVTTK